VVKDASVSENDETLEVTGAKINERGDPNVVANSDNVSANKTTFLGKKLDAIGKAGGDDLEMEEEEEDYNSRESASNLKDPKAVTGEVETD
jgi:hypothetical protein